MSGMITNLTATREALRELAKIVKATRQTLAAMIESEQQRRGASNKDRSGRLSKTLQHLEDVREGFIVSQRTASNVSLSELRELVEHILLDWNWLQEYNLTFSPGSQIELLDQQLVAYNHALVALAILPRLPAEAITFPQPKPSYRDVAVPALPGEKLARIEEIEQIVYQADVRPVETLAYAAFRRTYAFFEASSWLASSYLEPLLDELDQ